jgi:N-methylhydantoinase B
VEAWFASDGTLNAALGVRGGHPGGKSSQARLGADGSRSELPPCGGVILRPGDVLECRCCGGGGYGNPVERDPAQVRDDIAEGWISRKRGHDVYGVAPS